MNRKPLVAVAVVIASLALFTPSFLQAHSPLTLEGLAEQINAIFGRLDYGESEMQRLEGKILELEHRINQTVFIQFPPSPGEVSPPLIDARAKAGPTGPPTTSSPPSRDEQNYKKGVAQILVGDEQGQSAAESLAVLRDAFTRIEQNILLFYNEEWQASVTLAIDSLRISHENAHNLRPPVSLYSDHDKLVQILSACIMGGNLIVLAIDETASSLITGIDMIRVCDQLLEPIIQNLEKAPQ